MTRATVVIPTHDHADTLLRSIPTAQRQTLQDIEILVVGDGVPDRTREIMASFVRDDPRIRFFDNPKAARNGEIHRAAALRGARGHIACYLGDDDLWLPDHLEWMERALAEADFAHSLHLQADPDGKLWPIFFDLRLPIYRESLQRRPNGFGLSFGGHTMEAYRRLPEGWRTTPAGLPTDLFMWQQFMAQDWCRPTSLMRPTAIHFPSPMRRGWSLAQRTAELDRWLAQLARPDIAGLLALDAIRDAAGAYGTAPYLERQLAGLQAELGTVRAELAQARGELAAAGREAASLREAAAAAVAALAGCRAELQASVAEQQAILASRSWRLTGPLRRLAICGRRILRR